MKNPFVKNIGTFWMAGLLAAGMLSGCAWKETPGKPEQEEIPKPDPSQKEPDEASSSTSKETQKEEDEKEKPRPSTAFEIVEESSFSSDKTKDGLPLLNLDAEKKRISNELYQTGSSDDLQIEAWWQPEDFETLPVYQNPLVEHPSPVQMEARLREVLKTLNLPEDTPIAWNAQSPDQKEKLERQMAAGEEFSKDDMYMFTMTADAGDIRVSINPWGTLEILYVNPIPAGDINLTGTKDTSYADALIPIVQEQLSLSPLALWQGIGTLGFSAASDTSHIQYPIYLYQENAIASENLASATLSPIQIVGAEDGTIYMIRFYDKQDLKRVGDYPIRSLDEAKKALENGDYASGSAFSYQDAIQEGASVAGVRLVYRGLSEMDFDLIPWYQFIVEVPQQKNGDLNTYAAYYVPAVQAGYIE